MAGLKIVHVLLAIMIRYLDIISASTITPSLVINGVASSNDTSKREIQATPMLAWSMSQMPSSISSTTPSPVTSGAASLNDTSKHEIQATPMFTWSMSQMPSNISSTLQNGIISTSMLSVKQITITSAVMLTQNQTETLAKSAFGNLVETRSMHSSATILYYSTKYLQFIKSETNTISKLDAITMTASTSVMQTPVTKQSSAFVIRATASVFINQESAASKSVVGDAERTSQVSTDHITTKTQSGPQATTLAGAMTHSSKTVSTPGTPKFDYHTTSTQKHGQGTIAAINTKSMLSTNLDKFSFKATTLSSFLTGLMSSVQAPVTTSSPFINDQYLIFGVSGYLQNRTFNQDWADRTSHNYTILAMELSNKLHGILNQSHHFQKVEILNFTNDNSQVKVNAKAWFQKSSTISSGSLKAMIENGAMIFSHLEVKEICSPVSCNGNGSCQATSSDVNCSCLRGFQGFRCLQTYLVDGNFSHWSNYQSCSKSCGDGVQVRTRTCTNPTPMHGGRNCSSIGSATETKPCVLKSCNERWILWIIIAAAAFVFLMVVILACCFGWKKKYYYQDYGLTKDGTSYNLKTNQAYINRAYEAQLSEFRSHESVVPLEIIKEDPFKNGYSNPEFVGGDSIDQSSRTVYQRELKTFLNNTKNIRAKKNDDHGEYVEPEENLQPKKTSPSKVTDAEAGGIVYGNDPGRLL